MPNNLHVLLAASLPEDSEVRHCWQFFDTAVMAGWVSLRELAQLVSQLRAGDDVGIEELAIEHIDGMLRVSFLSDSVFCDKTVFIAAVERLLLMANAKQDPAFVC